MGAVKLMLRDPLPLDQLRAKLRELSISLPPARDAWLVKHANHGGLVIEKDRFYCRTCKANG